MQTEMATRKTESSLEALNAQIAELQAQADALRKKEVADVIEKIKTAIAHYGLTASDLGLAATTRKPGRPKKAVAASGEKPTRKNAAKKRQPPVVKYADDKGNTWVGMGKRPAWFTAALASGKKPEDLLVKA